MGFLCAVFGVIPVILGILMLIGAVIAAESSDDEPGPGGGKSLPRDDSKRLP